MVGRGIDAWRVERRKNGRARNGTGGWKPGGILGTGVGGGSARSNDRGGKIHGQHNVTVHRGKLARTIGRLSWGERLRMLCAEGKVWHGDWILQHYWTGEGD